ncbi:MAG: winged helix-turn-helix transcriptional regulator [Clostridiales bacterium]|nr:winged helix-turn-helix transcriptional regulator [Clostridiales bacterium]
MCFKKQKKKEYAPNNSIEEMATLFNMLGDYTRCKILSLLFVNKMRCSDIATNLKMSNSAISHSLKALKQSKIIKGERIGKEIYYTLQDNHIFKIFELAKEHIEE